MDRKRNKRMQAAARLIEKGLYERALAEYRTILTDCPEDTEVMTRMSELQLQIGKRSDAAATLVELGAVLVDQELHLKAISFFRTALKLDPERKDAHQHLADTYQVLGMLEETKHHLELLAQYHELSGNASASLKIYQQLIRMEPTNLLGLIKLAEIYSAVGKTSETIILLKQAAAFLKDQGRLQEYIKVLERLVHFDKKNILALKELANIYLQLGKVKPAQDKLHSAYQIDPKDLQLLDLMVRLFESSNNLRRAVLTLKAMIEIHKENYTLDKIHQTYERILKIDPDDPDAKAYMAT